MEFGYCPHRYPIWYIRYSMKSVQWFFMMTRDQKRKKDECVRNETFITHLHISHREIYCTTTLIIDFASVYRVCGEVDNIYTYIIIRCVPDEKYVCCGGHSCRLPKSLIKNASHYELSERQKELMNHDEDPLVSNHVSWESFRGCNKKYPREAKPGMEKRKRDEGMKDYSPTCFCFRCTIV